MAKTKPRIGVLLGDPTGIGPELVARLFADPVTADLAGALVIGDRSIFEKGRRIANVPETMPPFLEFISTAPDFPCGEISAEAGAYTLAALRFSIETLRRGTIDALVYAPLNKQAMKLAGLNHEDELQYFASLLDHRGTVSEINVCEGLWTSRVTSHVPLREVADRITGEKIVASANLLRDTLVMSGVSVPRLAIAALNPHAGEGGLFGREEAAIIGPAVEHLKASGVDATGPLPADTLFIAARRGRYDGVVTMYHDQGQIALKLLGFDKGVTVSGGLPAPVVTPAHGTAFDIAGKGVARLGAMKEAFRIACRMAR